MRHQKAAELEAEAVLDAIVESKHRASRAILATAKPEIIARYQIYQSSIPKLLGLAPESWDDDTKTALLSCYNVGTKPLNKLKDDILGDLKARGEVNLLRCPYCMMNDPKTWDHYLPKDDFPEYSIYHPNLIYVCFGCNQRKSIHYDKDTLLYCHPYFTVPEDSPVLHCRVAVDNGKLAIGFYGAGIGDFEVPGAIAHQHLLRLDLSTRFQLEAAGLVGNLIHELRQSFPHGIESKVLRLILEQRYAVARNALGCNAWDSRLWHGLAECADLAAYVNIKIALGSTPSSSGFDEPSPPPPAGS